jgi:hypothetical protein
MRFVSSKIVSLAESDMPYPYELNDDLKNARWRVYSAARMIPDYEASRLTFAQDDLRRIEAQLSVASEELDRIIDQLRFFEQKPVGLSLSSQFNFKVGNALLLLMLRGIRLQRHIDIFLSKEEPIETSLNTLVSCMRSLRGGLSWAIQEFGEDPGNQGSLDTISRIQKAIEAIRPKNTYIATYLG